MRGIRTRAKFGGRVVPKGLAFCSMALSEHSMGLREAQLREDSSHIATLPLHLHSPACLLLLPLMGRALSLSLPNTSGPKESHPAPASASSFPSILHHKNCLPVAYSCFSRTDRLYI